MLLLTILLLFVHLVLSMEQSRPIVYERRTVSSGGTDSWEPVYTGGERVYTSRTSSSTSGAQPVYRGGDQVYTRRTVQTIPGSVRVYPGERVYTRRTVQTVPVGSQPVYTAGERVYTDGTRTVYQPYYTASGTSSGSSSSGSSGVCPDTGVRQYINGLSCREAISRDKWLCYDYATRSKECCEACLSYKISDDPSCMYGDRSGDCVRSLRPSQCYDPFNSKLCCQTCPQLKYRNAEPGCEYGDKDPARCPVIQASSCYSPNTASICCNTCARFKQQYNQPGCEYGDKDPVQCPIIQASNCYSPNTANICCKTCARLKQQYNQPGCEYGDKPAQFYAPGYGYPLDCRGYISVFGVDRCKENRTRNVCCFTCAGH
ncbi:uncharacterized protein LOC106174036 [Lingula anatina]|uniref:Uncharacterized protein LOC106174036 n=1 Tax=Lingula anatina TaxID=7574 RepID=A0A1S3JKB7_LINAN|nr:uncharacterized protein LOC106174036 [Lingula anatina]|eukprot:XP_013410865.1 uncharacterized protein LOC106174036 [Lingula anatina]